MESDSWSGLVNRISTPAAAETYDVVVAQVLEFVPERLFIEALATTATDGDLAAFARTLALSPNLTFAHIGVSAQDQHQTTVSQQQPWILARFEKSARPTWEIRRTPSRQLDEMVALSLVIRAPQDTITIGHINLWAQIERRRLGITSYQVRSQPSARGFTIAPN